MNERKGSSPVTPLVSKDSLHFRPLSRIPGLLPFCRRQGLGYMAFQLQNSNSLSLSLNSKLFPYFLLDDSHYDKVLEHYTKKEIWVCPQIYTPFNSLWRLSSLSRTGQNWVFHWLSTWPGCWVITCQDPCFLSDSLFGSLSGKRGWRETNSFM